MGLTSLKLQISPFHAPDDYSEGEFLVDSGASLTVLPQPLWMRLKLVAEDTVEVSLADGRLLSRKVANAFVRYRGKRAPTRVILGEPDDSPLLGVLTLEELGLVLDPLKRTVSAARLRM